MNVLTTRGNCVLYGHSRGAQALPHQRQLQPQHLPPRQTLRWHPRQQSPQRQQPRILRRQQHRRQMRGPWPPVSSSLLQAASWP
jgi:hypothetical protein